MRFDDPKIIEWIKTAKRDDICSFLVCEVCDKQVFRTKHELQQAMSPSTRKRKLRSRICCSGTCALILSSKYTQPILVTCALCTKSFSRRTSEVKKSKSGLSFCSKSCAGKYSNQHKIIGNRRSKLEIWLEQQLTSIYNNLTIEFNTKTAIQSELDIYIPDLKLAFELNGIFHYEPIYGEDKLKSIQNNDDRKFQACLKQGIELCIIDSANQKRFTEASSKQYLDIITTLINSKLLVTE